MWQVNDVIVNQSQVANKTFHDVFCEKKNSKEQTKKVYKKIYPQIEYLCLWSYGQAKCNDEKKY